MSVRESTRVFGICALHAHAFHLRAAYCRAFALLSVNRNLLGEPDALDFDADFVVDLRDNARLTYNPLQRDLDRDGIPDILDADIDGDGIPNAIDPDPTNPSRGKTGQISPNDQSQSHSLPGEHSAIHSATGARLDLLA